VRRYSQETNPPPRCWEILLEFARRSARRRRRWRRCSAGRRIGWSKAAATWAAQRIPKCAMASI